MTWVFSFDWRWNWNVLRCVCECVGDQKGERVSVCEWVSGRKWEEDIVCLIECACEREKVEKSECDLDDEWVRACVQERERSVYFDETVTAFLSGNLIWLVRGRSPMFWRQAEGKFNQNFHLRNFFPTWRQFQIGATVDIGNGGCCGWTDIISNHLRSFPLTWRELLN